MHRGAAASAGLKHCATSGERHDTSQRLPLLLALQELTPLDEFVVVLPTLLEVFELMELLELTAFVELVALLAFTVLVALVELPELTC